MTLKRENVKSIQIMGIKIYKDEKKVEIEKKNYYHSRTKRWEQHDKIKMFLDENAIKAY